MKKILFVCDFYYPNATSIGVCTHKVAKVLQGSGNSVHVLSFGKNKWNEKNVYDGITFFCIKKRFHERCIEKGSRIGGIVGKVLCCFGKLKCRIWQLLWFPFFRMDGLIVPLRYYRAISKLHKQYGYDMIIATYNPFEGMLASYWFKKRYSDVLLSLYILDTLTHIGKTSFISEKLNDKKGWRWEKRIFPYCDQIINLRCHEEHHKQKRYDPFRSKMVFSDIPFLEENNAVGKCFDTQHIHFVYTGRILKNRSSSYASSLFEKLSENKPYILHYYSAGDEESIIKAYEKKTNGRIIGHGLVPHEQISLIQKCADVLVSIGNLGSEKITSKIFEYMSTGNRIIHFQKDVNDSAVLYYQKYKNTIILNENDPIEKNINKLERFLDTPSKQVEFNRVSKLFYENLPKYTADLVINVLARRYDS